MRNSEKILEVNGATLKYGERVVINEAAFAVKPGEITVLVGANGAGKTTLLRAMNGGVPVAAGEILIDGEDISKMTRRAIAKKTAVVAQENETKFPVKVVEFIMAGRFPHSSVFGGESAEDIAAVENEIDECGLREIRGSLMNELSGGERQRVVLARALAAETDLLLLDEPTANLDLSHQVMMFGLIRRRCEDRRFASVVIMHDLNLAAAFADRMIILADGGVIAAGLPEVVMTPENIKKAFGVDVVVDENPATSRPRMTMVY